MLLSIDYRNALVEIKESSSEDLVRKAQLGERFALYRVGNMLDRLKYILSQIDDRTYDLFTADQAQLATSYMKEITNVLSRARSFNPETENAQGIRQDIENGADNVLSRFIGFVGPILSVYKEHFPLDQWKEEQKREIANATSEISSVSDERFRAASAIVQENVRRVDEELNLLEKKHSELDNLSSGLRASLAEIQTTRESEYFSRAGRNYRNSANIWLISTIGSFIILMFFAGVFLLYSFSPYFSNIQSVQAIQIGTSKIVFLGLLVYITSTLSRNYFANRHNQTVNEHRANALSSYRALVEATSTPEQRDIVLAQAATAVFAPQDTAFVKAAPQGSENPLTIVSSLTKAAGAP